MSTDAALDRLYSKIRRNTLEQPRRIGEVTLPDGSIKGIYETRPAMRAADGNAVFWFDRLRPA